MEILCPKHPISALELQEMEAELNNLITWLEEKELQISSYLPEKPIDHPILSKTEIIENIITSVKSGNLNAIELACNLAIQNKHIPFWKSLKSNIFEALKKQEKYISTLYREKLVSLAIKYINAPYPAKETKSLCRLLKQFEPQYSKQVINNINSSSKEAKRWVEYLDQSL